MNFKPNKTKEISALTLLRIFQCEKTSYEAIQSFIIDLCFLSQIYVFLSPTGQVLDSRSQSPWRLSLLVDLFWGAVEFIGLL